MLGKAIAGCNFKLKYSGWPQADRKDAAGAHQGDDQRGTSIVHALFKIETLPVSGTIGASVFVWRGFRNHSN